MCSRRKSPTCQQSFQLVILGRGTWGGPLGWGYPSWSFSWGVHLCSLLRGSTSVFTSRGAHFHVHFQRVHFCVHFWGVHFCVHFWGVPCDLSHNALDVTSLLSRHQLIGLAQCSCFYTLLPHCIMREVTWDPPSQGVGKTDRQTNTTENITFPHTTYAGGKYWWSETFSFEGVPHH